MMGEKKSVCEQSSGSFDWLENDRGHLLSLEVINFVAGIISELYQISTSTKQVDVNNKK